MDCLSSQYGHVAQLFNIGTFRFSSITGWNENLGLNIAMSKSGYFEGKKYNIIEALKRPEKYYGH